ncbi:MULTISPECIES: SDR family NAD(P)-dependent oxidoreductase [unclassified Novosphingobium]|uniref:SDR family NAD(P)-dependent oxidoreductase n=1 Tax=unclassified Novosphingobium TaxID=2644732 RepID=UPI00190F8BBF|nr:MULTISPECIES: SDR family NAD(P)-dependent oxidoreductase [unclassified Novosphingobium]
MVRKVALVTGAAAGIGAASALRLARDGIAVGVLDLDVDRCSGTVDSIAEAGGEAIALGADITDRDQVRGAVAQLHDRFGPIAITVNNAGIPGFKPFLEIDDALWDHMMRVNLTGAFIVTQAVLPGMIAAQWGRVINISSMAAQAGAKDMAHYAASKAGMIGMTRALAHEFGPAGITFNVVPPRFITGTIMSDNSFAAGKQPMAREAEVQAGPIRREGRPEDIAGAVAWLASEEAGFVTGQVIGVNGGRYI